MDYDSIATLDLPGYTRIMWTNEREPNRWVNAKAMPSREAAAMVQVVGRTQLVKRASVDVSQLILAILKALVA